MSDPKDVMAANVAAFEQTVRATLELAADLTEEQWDTPTECPGWTVRDMVSHLVGIELMLLGEDPAPGHVIPDDLPHVRNALGRAVEPAVDARRSRPGAEVLAELGPALERRLAALPAIDPELPTIAPTGSEVTYAEFMAFRAFDCWVHEQDIRRALGRPGNLDAPAAACVLHIVLPGLARVVAKRAGATPGQSVTFEVTGPVAFTEHVLVEPDGQGSRARSLDGDPTATVRVDWESFLRLITGRGAPASVPAEVSGDEVLAEKVLANMSLTP